MCKQLPIQVAPHCFEKHIQQASLCQGDPACRLMWQLLCGMAACTSYQPQSLCLGTLWR